MAGADNAELTREGLIWRVAELIASAEGKPLSIPGNLTKINRDYMLNLIRAIGQAIDGKEATPLGEMSDQELQAVIRQEGERE